MHTPAAHVIGFIGALFAWTCPAWLRLGFIGPTPVLVSLVAGIAIVAHAASRLQSASQR
jgi:hypothetical protein